MVIDLSKLSVPLRIDQIDFRVQSINKGGYATILAYKDARCDMQRLDEVVGPLGWQRQHTRDNHNCVVSIWDVDNQQWVEKEDVGTESNAESEKGLASDSFKRACFNWGIGRELYDYPVIQVKLRKDEFDPATFKATYNLQVKTWKWEAVWDGKVLLSLIATDNGAERYRYNLGGRAYTLEQKAYFDMLLDSEAALEYIEFANSVDKAVITDLFNSGEANNIVALKKKCMALEAKAHEILDLLAGDIGQQVLQDDIHALHLATETFEVGPYVRKALWGRLNKDEQDKLVSMKEQNNGI